MQEDYDRQLAQREVEPEGPADKPWEQAIEPEMVDTAEFKSDKSGNYNICFSNAAIDNPWRQVGWKTMQEEVKLHDEIGNFRSSTPRRATTSRSPTSRASRAESATR